jgi:predicted nucleic acid-binding protein
MSKLTFVDSGVLIAAARGTDEAARRAMAVLDDPERSFASSAFVRLEVLPKALRHRREAEARFYDTFFQSVSAWATIVEPLVTEAFSQAQASDLHAMDALHVAAALSMGAEEFVTSERAEKPINKVTSIAVRTIHPPTIS